jgi:hypothetical protein
MGVKTTLAGITFTAGGKNQAATAGCDINGMIAELQLHCSEMNAQLIYLVTELPPSRRALLHKSHIR